MASTAPTPSLRKVLDEYFSLLSKELEHVIEREVASRVSQEVTAVMQSAVVEAVRDARNSAQRELAEHLNQSLRRLRQAENFEQVSLTLADSAKAFCQCVAVFSVSGGTVKGEVVRGLADETAADRFRSLEFSAAQAAAFAGSIETGDPMVAMSTPAEVSAPIIEIFGHQPEDRIAIFPVVVRRETVGLLYVLGGADGSPLELLAQAAGLTVEARTRPAPVEAAKPSDLVALQSARPSLIPPRQIPDSWEELTPEDQKLHLRAQRFARVEVAGMKLFQPDAVKAGRKNRDLYSALQNDIHSGREVFRETFLSATPTMVDYFHLELVRTLANDDPALLGENYPGPLV